MTTRVSKKSKKVVKVKKVDEVKAFAGSLLLRNEPTEFCPNAWLDKLGFAKENRPVFILRPLNSKQKHIIEQENKKMMAEGLLWAKKNGLPLDEKDALSAYIIANKSVECSDMEKRYDIIRQCIIGWKCSNSEVLGDFKKAETDDGLHHSIFERFPFELINLIDLELNKMTSLTGKELLGL